METRSKIIVIADDEETLRCVLSQELRAEGYDPYTFDLKYLAYDWIVENKPDLIISDIKSPGMDGFEFLKWLKQNPYTNKIPFIYLTGFSDLKNKIESQRLGAADFVSKPYELTDLIETIKRILEEELPENMYPPELSLEQLADNDCIKFLSWRNLRDLIEVTIDTLFERNFILEKKYIWTTCFIFEYENKLYGGLFFRPIEYAYVDGYDVLTLLNQIKDYGVEKGVIFSFFAPQKKVKQYANLLGVDIVSGEITNRILSHSINSNLLRDTRLGQLKVSDEFLKFMELFKNNLRQLDGISFVIHNLENKQQFVAFSVNDTSDSFRLGFVLKPEEDARVKKDINIWIDDIPMQEILAELWCERKVLKNDLTENKINNLCLIEILKYHKYCRVENEIIYLDDVQRSKRNKPLLVLLDDSDNTREIFGMELASEGFNIVCYEDKAKFLELIPQIKPSLIISDLISPNLTGFEFLQHMKAKPNYQNIPVIILSGNCEDREKVKKAYNCGAYACYSKADGLQKLVKEIRKILNKL